MKTYVLVLMCFCSIALLNAQDADLTGTWTMFEMSYNSPEGAETMTEEQMKANNAVTEYVVMEGGKIKMTSNMSGSGSMDTYEGTWKYSENKFTYSLMLGGQLRDIVWNCEVKDNIMKLTRSNPEGTMKITNSFRKKQP